jgi:hypothetical protein
VLVPLGKGGCMLLLTEREYREGIKRGKRWRRAQDVARREALAGTGDTHGPSPS